jgi:hypothetical protein
VHTCTTGLKSVVQQPALMSEAFSASSAVCRPTFCSHVCAALTLQHLPNVPLVPAIKLPHLFVVFCRCCNLIAAPVFITLVAQFGACSIAAAPVLGWCLQRCCRTCSGADFVPTVKLHCRACWWVRSMYFHACSILQACHPVIMCCAHFISTHQCLQVTRPVVVPALLAFAIHVRQAYWYVWIAVKNRQRWGSDARQLGSSLGLLLLGSRSPPVRPRKQAC